MVSTLLDNTLYAVVLCSSECKNVLADPSVSSHSPHLLHPSPGRSPFTPAPPITWKVTLHTSSTHHLHQHLSLVESSSERSADESKQKIREEQPRIHDELKQKIEQKLEQRIQQEQRQRIQQEQRQKSGVGNGGQGSRQHFQQFEEARKKMPRGNQLPRSRREESDKPSYDGDSDDGGGCGSCLAALIQWPVIIAASIIIPVFGVTFIIMGALNIHHCKIEPMIPIWLIVQGFIMVFGIGVGGMAKKTSSNGSISLPVKIVGFVVSAATVVWFAAGNFWVYQAWGKSPDYAHDWFENGCNKSLFNLAFVGVIVLDALFIISAVVGCIAFVLRGCKSR